MSNCSHYWFQRVPPSCTSTHELMINKWQCWKWNEDSDSFLWIFHKWGCNINKVADAEEGSM
jgi:hypothetical protein